MEVVLNRSDQAQHSTALLAPAVTPMIVSSIKYGGGTDDANSAQSLVQQLGAGKSVSICQCMRAIKTLCLH